MIFNIGKFTLQALKSNNWQGVTCTPDVIFITLDKLNEEDVNSI